MLPVIVVCFAIYGLAMAIWQLWHLSGRRPAVFSPAVIVVIDQSNEWIEWFVRKVSFEFFSVGHGPVDVLIVDKSASPETSEIVSRLQRSYRFITYVPSSHERCWSDVVSLLEAAKRSQALFVELENERDVRRAVRMIAQLSP